MKGSSEGVNENDSSGSEFESAELTDVRLPSLNLINVSDSLLDEAQMEDPEEDKGDDGDQGDETPPSAVPHREELEENIQAGLERRVKRFKAQESKDESDDESDWRSKLV